MNSLFPELTINSPDVRRVSVCVPLNVDRVFDYIVPDEMETPAYGAYVQVLFAGRMVTGIVWGEATSPELPAHKLKPLTAHVKHLPPLSDTLRTFIEQAARYYCVSLGSMVKLALPVMKALEQMDEVQMLERTGDMPEGFRLTPARTRLLSLLEKQAIAYDEIRKHGVAASVIAGCQRAGVIRRYTSVARYEAPVLLPDPPTLTQAQMQAASVMKETLGEGFHRFLLDGATGSGKTEVFFDVAEAAMQRGEQVLVLLPEIALTLQLVERAKKRFGFAPTIWHSSQSPAARRDALRRIMHGGAPLVVGARSALFLPYHALGLIVVDEEHDSSFKQEEGALYHGRDMAVLRAQIEQIPVVLASATPSLETLHNAQEGRYHHITLKRRKQQAALPRIHTINMKQQTLEKGCWISQPLQEAIRATLQAGRQSLLFMNRRGYAPLMLCKACGHRYECPSCTAWLVYHTAHHQMLCHHCGLSIPMPESCHACGADAEHLVLYGAGIERIAEEAKLLCPDARIMALSGEMSQHPARLREALQRITAGEVDIVIGTQLLAKGHHFPNLSMVGVIDADAGLHGGDIRGAEKTYRMLHQLAGRAGREEVQGDVYIQTYKPDHPLLGALTSWDRAAFVDVELQHRRMSHMPPYGRLAALIVEGKPESAVQETANALAKSMPQHENVTILGAAPAPLYKLRNLYRMRFLVIVGKRVAVQPLMLEWKARVKRPKTVSVTIDIDPVSFM